MNSGIGNGVASGNSRPLYGNNFGALRYLLAFMIVWLHYHVLTGSPVWTPPGHVVVGGFFVMSGFMIYGSYRRAPNRRAFLANRARRLLPSYLLTVLGCAVLLAAVSDFAAVDYFTSPQWLRYVAANVCFLNFAGPSLPGVFSSHPVTAVNGSLWTLKVEWLLYFMVIGVIWLTRRSRRPFWQVFMAVFALSAACVYGFTALHDRTGSAVWAVLGRQTVAQVSFFYSGALLYIYLDLVKRHKYLIGAVCAVVLVLGQCLVPGEFVFRSVLLPLSLAGVLVTAAFTGRWGEWADRIGDCSYEIYLLHFPAVQLCRHYGLHERLGDAGAFAVVLVCVVALAYVLAHRVSAPLRRAMTPRRRPSVSAG